jgi:hypothetical protein
MSLFGSGGRWIWFEMFGVCGWMYDNVQGLEK